MEYRLFYLVGMAVIIFGFLYSAYHNYRDCREKLKIDFEEEQDDWYSWTNEPERL